MKKIVLMVCGLAVLGSGLWAQDTLLEADVASLKVSVYGDANARFGMQSMTADPTHLYSAGLMAGLSGNSAKLMADITAAMTPFGTALGASYMAAGGPGHFADMTGPEIELARKAGFTESNFGDVPTWLTDNGIAMASIDATIAGHVDAPYAKDGMYFGLKNENAVRLGTKIATADGKLTAEVAAKFTTYIDVKTAWIQYDLGPVAIKYNSHDGNQRWDADVLYVGDASLENALDFQIKPVDGIGYAFFTLMSDEGVTSPVKYANTKFRSVPMMQLGYVYDTDLGDMGSVEATVGAALDSYGKKDADYLGYIAFGGATWSKGDMAVETGSLVVGLNGLYGQNTATLAGMNGSDMEQATLGQNVTVRMIEKDGKKKDSTVLGARLFGGATLWTGGVVSVDGRLSQLTFGGDKKPYTALRVTGGITQFLSGNFSATLGGGYEKYSVVAGDKDYKPASGYEITLDFGYRF